MELADDQLNAVAAAPPFAPPSYVSVSPYLHPSSRRLSSQFTPPTRPVRSVKQLACVSLQGRIIGADEASSAKAIRGNLSCQEALAWEMFSPMHRILIVAVIAVAAANSKKDKLIVQLKKSVEIRDQVLLGMQERLDNLCEQVNYFNNKPDISSYNFEFSDCGCRHCDHHQLPSEYKHVDSTRKVVDNDNMIKFKTANDVEQEERRMSDLSDWAPSVCSSIDVQWSTPIEQEFGKLQKGCEDKDATIKELTAFLNATESHSSKRIAELEDVIRRKNTLITKLRKDMMVLEQKVIHLTRLRRPSSSKPNSRAKKLPTMSDNLIYDMDSTTSPSDDSDSSTTNKNNRLPILNKINKEEHQALIRSRPKTCKSSEQQPFRPVSPLKEKSLNQQARPLLASKSKESRSSSGGFKSRNGTSSNSNKSRVSGSHKRWA